MRCAERMGEGRSGHLGRRWIMACAGGGELDGPLRQFRQGGLLRDGHDRTLYPDAARPVTGSGRPLYASSVTSGGRFVLGLWRLGVWACSRRGLAAGLMDAGGRCSRRRAQVHARSAPSTEPRTRPTAAPPMSARPPAPTAATKAAAPAAPARSVATGPGATNSRPSTWPRSWRDGFREPSASGPAVLPLASYSP